MDDSASSDSAEPKWRGLDMILSLACGGLRHCVEFRRPLEKLVECVGDDLLCRPAIHCAGEPELQVALRIEAERERGLALCTGSRARPWCATRSGLRSHS